MENTLCWLNPVTFAVVHVCSHDTASQSAAFYVSNAGSRLLHVFTVFLHLPLAVEHNVICSISICMKRIPSIHFFFFCLGRGLLLVRAAAGGRRGRRGGGRVALQPQVEEVAPPQPPQHGQQPGQPGAGPGPSGGGARLPRPAVCGGHGQQLPDRGGRGEEGPGSSLELIFFFNFLKCFLCPCHIQSFFCSMLMY